MCRAHRGHVFYRLRSPISSCPHDFYMITPRVGQQRITEASTAALALWRGRSNRRRQSVMTWNSRDAGGCDQQISRCPSGGCAVEGWCAAQCGQLGNGGKRNSNRVAPACQLSKAAHADAAPPCTHASMSAHRCSFSRRCCCACADFSSKAQYSF